MDLRQRGGGDGPLLDRGDEVFNRLAEVLKRHLRHLIPLARRHGVGERAQRGDKLARDGRLARAALQRADKLPRLDVDAALRDGELEGARRVLAVQRRPVRRLRRQHPRVLVLRLLEERLRNE